MDVGDRTWRALLAVGAALALTITAACGGGGAPPAAAPLPGADAGDRLAAAATVDGAFAHLQAFQGIADRAGGTRALGSPGYDASVDHVADTLRRAGFRVETPTVPVDEEGPKSTTRNVVAQTTTGRADEVVVAGAHLDSVETGPGIDDNGSGAAALLEIATRLGAAPRTANAVRFVWFGAEEDGLVGSKRYVEGLSADDRRGVAVMLNADMLASPNAGFFVYDGDNSERRGAAGPPGSGEIERRLLARADARGASPRTVPLVGSSDYGSFVDAGIAAGGLTSGSSGIKTADDAARWGGRAGVAYDPCYHQACDTLANLDRAAYGRTLDTLAFGVGSFAADLDGVPPRSARTG